MKEVSIITVTLDRPSLALACESVELQTHPRWHHYVLGDGVPPTERRHPNRSCLGFSRSLGREEPGINMPDGTPNPLQRWALRHLDLGDLVCFLDDDNVYSPRFLERMVAALLAAPDKGLALCGVEDRRYGQNIEGLPRPGSCDNSGAMFRREVVKAVPFPRADPNREVIQDCEYIALCADRFGWVHVPEVLVTFGAAPDLPPNRGGVKLVSSWEGPLRAERKMRAGEVRAAREELAEIVARDPNDAWSLFHLGEACLLLDDREGAKSAWSRWLELAARAGVRTNAWVFFMQALASHLVLGPEKSLDAIGAGLALADARIEADPNDGDAWIKRGLFRLMRGEPARVCFDRASFLRDRSLLDEASWELSILAQVYGRADSIDEAMLLLGRQNRST